jgi:hypothetical protein
VDAGLAAARHALAAGPSLAPEHADELAVLATFLRTPPPELAVCPLEHDVILRACTGGAAAALRRAG